MSLEKLVLEYIEWRTRRMWGEGEPCAVVWVRYDLISEYVRGVTDWGESVVLLVVEALVRQGVLDMGDPDLEHTLFSYPGVADQIRAEKAASKAAQDRLDEAQNRVVRAVQRFGGNGGVNLSTPAGSMDQDILQVVGAENILALAEALKRAGGGG